MTPLEDQLVAGMREHTAGLTPAPDLLDRAVRGNRRRRARFAAATGALGVTAVLTVVFASTGTPPAAPAPLARPVLTAAEVSQRAIAALATDDVEHARIVVRQQDKQYTQEFWYDSVTGDMRHHDVVPLIGDRLTDTWTIRRNGTATVAYVDHAARTWWTHERPDDTGKSGSHAPYTPEELRQQLSEGTYQLVGEEQLDGQPVIHLRKSYNPGGEDLWVDAGTYRAVRRQIVKAAPIGDIVATLDFDWPPRTPESLRPLVFTPPDGYRETSPQ